jgi:hypothetical protein
MDVNIAAKRRADALDSLAGLAMEINEGYALGDDRLAYVAKGGKFKKGRASHGGEYYDLFLLEAVVDFLRGIVAADRYHKQRERTATNEALSAVNAPATAARGRKQ